MRTFIVFARIREEIATGKSVQTSMKIGFQKAMSAILDGNITTLIASVVLMALGSGTVKGFAYTLMIGIILSPFYSNGCDQIHSVFSVCIGT